MEKNPRSIEVTLYIHLGNRSAAFFPLSWTSLWKFKGCVWSAKNRFSPCNYENWRRKRTPSQCHSKYKLNLRTWVNINKYLYFHVIKGLLDTLRVYFPQPTNHCSSSIRKIMLMLRCGRNVNEQRELWKVHQVLRLRRRGTSCQPTVELSINHQFSTLYLNAGSSSSSSRSALI